MLKVNLTHAKDGVEAEIAHTPFGHILATSTPCKLFSHFNAATRTTAGTTILVQPTSGNAIALTDILISGEKKAGTLTVRFTDGTNTINIIVVPLTDAPANYAIPFVGRWAGWRNARVEMVTDAVANITVAVGYVRIGSEFTQSYAEWDAER
jgi:hypothetical protein